MVFTMTQKCIAPGVTMNLPSIRDSAFTPSNQSLEEILIELENYGEPRLVKMKNGWYAVLQVFVTGKGVSFEAKSDFNFTSPHGAASQCYDRLILAIKLIKETK